MAASVDGVLVVNVSGQIPAAEHKFGNVQVQNIAPSAWPIIAGTNRIGRYAESRMIELSGCQRRLKPGNRAGEVLRDGVGWGIIRAEDPAQNGALAAVKGRVKRPLAFLRKRH